MDLRINMTIQDVAAHLQTANPEMAAIVTSYTGNMETALGQVQTLQKDVKTSAEKRDALKTIVRNATGLDDISQESLTAFLASKGDGQSDILRTEITELQGKLAGSVNAVDEVSGEYEKTIFGLKLDRAVNMLGAADEVHSPHAYNVIIDELSRGATFEKDEIVYKNEDGSSIFTKDGQAAGIKSRYEDMKADEAFSYLFKEQFKSGGGKPAASGPTSDAGGVTLKRSSMSDTDKVKYISKHSMSAYRNLPM